MQVPWAQWRDVEGHVLKRPPRHDLHIMKSAVPHPRESGMKRHVGVPRGTIHHFRRALEGPGCLHVREYRRHYEVHWDEVDPTRNPIGHIWVDVRGGKVLTAALGLALVALPFAVF